jgi:hypothetical protein
MLRVRDRPLPVLALGVIAAIAVAPTARADLEPNDVGVQAEGVPAHVTTFAGTVGPGDTDDWYRFTVHSSHAGAGLRLTRTSPSTETCRSPEMLMIDHTYGGGVGIDLDRPDEPTVVTPTPAGVSVWYFHAIRGNCEQAYAAEITGDPEVTRIDTERLTSSPVPEPDDTPATAFRIPAENGWYAGQLDGPADEEWATFAVGPGTHRVTAEVATAANGVPNAAVVMTTNPAVAETGWRSSVFGANQTLDVTGPTQVWVRTSNQAPFSVPIPWWISVDAGGAFVPVAAPAGPPTGPPTAPTPRPAPPFSGPSCRILTATVRRPRAVRARCRDLPRGARVQTRVARRLKGGRTAAPRRRTVRPRKGVVTVPTKGLRPGRYRVSLRWRSELAARTVRVR